MSNNKIDLRNAKLVEVVELPTVNKFLPIQIVIGQKIQISKDQEKVPSGFVRVKLGDPNSVYSQRYFKKIV